MSYLYSSQVELKPNANIDAFGRLRASQITSVLEVTHIYDKNPLEIDESVGGAATSTYSPTNSCVDMAVSGNGDWVVRQTKQFAIYQPGKSQLFEASFSSMELQSNVIKRVGYFTSATSSTYSTAGLDGFFLESDGQAGEISFQIWRSGVQVAKKTTGQWLTADASVSTIDWAKTNLMFCDFQWLGVGLLRFGLVIDGQVRFFVKHSGSNNLDFVYMTTPNKPIRHEIRSVGGAGDMTQICSQVSVEGAVNALYKSAAFTNLGVNTFPDANSRYPLIGFTVDPAKRGVTALVTEISILQTSNDNYYLTLELNPTISGTIFQGTYSNVPVKGLYATGSQTVTTPGRVLKTYTGKSGTELALTINLEDSNAILGQKLDGAYDQCWLCIIPMSNNSTFRSAINVKYYD